MLGSAPTAFGPEPLAPTLMGLVPEDARHLIRALELGRRGWGRVQPNPLVGCVIVRRGEVVGEGWHHEYGGPHAEVHALRAAGNEARGATAYVSLEPCGHYGQTPPCTLALLEAGVARVVFGAGDPEEESGGGAQSLKRAGLQVEGPFLTPAESWRENPAFFRPAQTRRPYLALKLAVSLDGAISVRPGQRTGISAQEALDWVQVLRAGFDSILVGSRTLRVDDPLLTVRGPVSPVRPPTRIILDRKAQTRDSARIFREGNAPTAVFVGAGAREGQMERLEALGAVVHPVPEGREGLDLARIMAVCGETGLGSILCEGGGILAASLLKADLVDRIYLVVAPLTLGPGAVPAFPGLEGQGVWERFRLSHVPQALGQDVVMVYDRQGGDPTLHETPAGRKRHVQRHH